MSCCCRSRDVHEQLAEHDTAGAAVPRPAWALSTLVTPFVVCDSLGLSSRNIFSTPHNPLPFVSALSCNWVGGKKNKSRSSDHNKIQFRIYSSTPGRHKKLWYNSLMTLVHSTLIDHGTIEFPLWICLSLRMLQNSQCLLTVPCYLRF